MSKYVSKQVSKQAGTSALADCLAALAHLAQGDIDMQDAIIEAGGVTPLLALVRGSSGLDGAQVSRQVGRQASKLE